MIPVTPVIAEALTSLHDIIKQDSNRTLLKAYNQFLFKINSEAKTRRSTRLVVLGKAKVMSFEDLEEARIKRAAKDEAAARKRRRGPKRKGPRLEAEGGLPVSESKVMRVDEALAATNAARP
ncbi:hypothetical protein PSPO01_06100 [Paraphaeosphaeria sporulosa]